LENKHYFIPQEVLNRLQNKEKRSKIQIKVKYKFGDATSGGSVRFASSSWRAIILLNS
jgi:hypothetical protein